MGGGAGAVEAVIEAFWGHKRCGANLKSGINAILDIVNFDEELKDASLIITGEGTIDGQSK